MSEAKQPAAQVPPAAAQGAAQPAPAADPAPKAQEAKPAEAPAATPEKPAAEAKPAPAPEAPKTEPAKDPAAEATPAQKEDNPATEQKPEAPEKYELKLPKDSPLSDSHIEKLSAYAKERGLSNEQAQSLLERESQAVSDYASNLQSKQKEMAQSWVETAKNDKEIGGKAFGENAELAKRVVHRFGTPDFLKELNKTGLGNHPELVRIFSRIGKAMDDDKLVLPGHQPSKSSKKSPQEVLYGKTSEKEN